jgi:hypothetical protein
MGRSGALAKKTISETVPLDAQSTAQSEEPARSRLAWTTVSFVGLRNPAAVLVEHSLNGGGQIGKRTYGQLMNKVRSRVTGDVDLARR